MSEELAYVLINPYTIAKSRTGGVIARLLSRAGSSMIAARMFAPSKALIEEYIKVLGESRESRHPEIEKLIIEYLNNNYAPDKKTGQKRRVMFLLFKGANIIHKLKNDIVGHITKETIAGETVRDTYGDFIKEENGNVKYFEPAAIIGTDPYNIEKELKVWAKFSEKDSGVLRDVIEYSENQNKQETLVLIKPDCFKWPSGRPGNIIDMFSKTGLYIIAAKVLRLSVEEALEFYGPVKAVLKEKLKDSVILKVKNALENKFEFKIEDDYVEKISDNINDLNAEYQFKTIVKFMTGVDIDDVGEEKYSAPGIVKCLALVYQGVDAIKKIRTVLGATDPSKAAPATVRREFGQDVLVNTAHASDSVENSKREINIVKIEENDIKHIIDDYYG